MITFNTIDVHIIVLQPSPQQDGCLYWHIMIYSSVLSPELLEKAVAASSVVGKMLDRQIIFLDDPCLLSRLRYNYSKTL